MCFRLRVIYKIYGNSNLSLSVHEVGMLQLGRMYFLTTVLVFWFEISHAETLQTTSYRIGVEWRCEQNSVTCDNVFFTVLNLETEEQMIYVGRTHHSICADGVTPCKFQGYSFQVESGLFRIYSRGELEIIASDGEILVAESGRWLY